MSSYASSLDDAIRDPKQEVSFKVKPLQAVDSSSGGPSQPSAEGAPPVPGSAPLGFGLEGMSLLSSEQQNKLKKNPQLASTPSTVQQDDVYAAQLAQARHQTTAQYLSMLRDIGFMDDTGRFLPGLIETEAARRRSSLQEQERLARSKIDHDSIRGGAFFSGRRAKNLADASNPYTRDLAALETDVPRLLTDRYNDIGNLLSGFSITQDQLLAELAQREAARAQAQPSGPIATPGTLGGPGGPLYQNDGSTAPDFFSPLQGIDPATLTAMRSRGGQ